MQLDNDILGVSENSGTPKSSYQKIGFSIINHPFWGTSMFGNTHLGTLKALGNGLENGSTQGSAGDMAGEGDLKI